ncbi:MAG: hypothetical protein ACI93T_002007, partial [Porticoccaceae bacterium]
MSSFRPAVKTPQTENEEQHREVATGARANSHLSYSRGPCRCDGESGRGWNVEQSDGYFVR